MKTLYDISFSNYDTYFLHYAACQMEYDWLNRKK